MVWHKKYTKSDEPEESCAYINAVEKDLESIREINKELRAWGAAGWDRVEELEADIREKNERIAFLEADLDALSG